MNTQPAIVGLPSSADAYIRHGWKLCAIPAGTKGPTATGWNKVENALTEAPQDGSGIGLLHAYSQTAALDVDDLELASAWLAERGIDLQQLMNAPDAVGIDSGNPGHGKLLFALPFPMPSKKITINGKVALELRCASANGLSVQDVLPPSRHPSGTTYRWTGRGHWQSLPLLPEKLTELWAELTFKDNERNIKTEPNCAPTSYDELRSALMATPADCARKQWVESGMALATAATTPEEAEQLFALWDEWSQQSATKYPGRAEMVKQWRSFKDVPNGITVGTLFHYAALSHWRRPPPDVKDLFAPLPDHTPREAEQMVTQLSAKALLPDNDLSLWPPILVARAKELAVEVGCDPIVPLMAGLMAVSGAANKQSALIINPSWRVSPTFWAMTIGEPADKKTPGSKPMFLPLRKLEAEDRARFEVEMLSWVGKEARHAAEMKAYREWQQSPEAMMPGAVPPTVMGLPPQPQPLRLVLTDATTQKVVSMAEHRPRGFLLYLDEMNRWLTKLSDTRHSDDRGCWIQGYETGPYSMDRMGAGTIRVENMALSIYGNCQPAVFRQNLASASTDGILQRFMPVIINPKHNLMWQDAVPSFMSSADSYEQLIRRVFATPGVDYTLSAEAKEVFRAFSQWALRLRDSQRLLNDSATYQTALGKMEGNCARLLLLFHIVDAPYDLEVSGETALRATELFKTFFVPSLRYAFLEVGKQRDDIADHVFNMVLQWASARPTVSLSELRAEVKNKSEKKDHNPTQLDLMIRATMDDLTNCGHVAMYQDHPRYPTWTINPAMAELYANERKKIVLARQATIDLLNERIINHSGKPAHGGANAIGFIEDMRA